MKINISENLRMEVNIPILWVENFQIEWQVNQHALLVVNGYKKFDVNIDQEKFIKVPLKYVKIFKIRIKFYLMDMLP